MVQEILSNRAGVHTEPLVPGNFGRGALQQAAGSGNVELVRLLLSRSWAVNAEAARVGGATALQAAASNGDLKVVQLLLDAGADIKQSGSSVFGGTVLQQAAQKGHEAVVRLLLEKGADVSAAPQNHSPNHLPNHFAGFNALESAYHGGH